MATNLFRLYRSAADVDLCRAAPAPSGGVYVAEGTFTVGTNGNISNVLRLSSSGAIVWNKEITLTGAFGAHPYLASNATHLAVAHEGGGSGTGVTLYAADGTEVWSTSVPLLHNASTGADPYDAPPIAIGPDNSVFVFGSIDVSFSYQEAVLTKLNASDGSIDWSVNLRDSASAAAGLWSGSLSVLTGGDVVVHVRGTLNYVLRLSGTDGSVVWSKGVVWPSGSSETAVGSDGDDNVYLCGRPHGTTPKILPVVKLASDGSTLWNRNIDHGSGLTSLGLDYKWSGRLTCDDTGVFIQCYFDDALERSGHVFVPADGTIATGTALVAAFDNLGGVDVFSNGSSGGTDLHSVFAYADKASPAATYAEAIVAIAGSSASEDGEWGGRDRVTYGFDVEAGSATISTQTYTRASMPSFSASSFSFTEGAGTLLVETFVEVYNASSIEPTTAFGTPRRVGYVLVEEYTPSTAFGTPRLVSTVTASAVESSVSFGTAALQPDRSVTATAVTASTAFGLPEASRTAIPQPHVADSLGPGTSFGRPTASAVGAHAASGFSTTSFGTPVLGLPVTAEGFTSTALGTPTLRCLAQPSGFRSTIFGTPMRVSLATAVGFARTQFGTPRALSPLAGTAEGLTSTSFGTPSCLNSAQRARSGVFRTQWGLAQAERTTP